MRAVSMLSPIGRGLPAVRHFSSCVPAFAPSWDSSAPNQGYRQSNTPYQGSGNQNAQYQGSRNGYTPSQDSGDRRAPYQGSRNAYTPSQDSGDRRAPYQNSRPPQHRPRQGQHQNAKFQQPRLDADGNPLPVYEVRPDTFKKSAPPHKPRHFITLADLTVPEINRLVMYAMVAKGTQFNPERRHTTKSTIAMIFNKRSTRTRVAGESAAVHFAAHPMFLGKDDIQLGVNESLHDSAKVISSMVRGIVARVGAHSEIEEFAEHSHQPVVNALSDLYHPTQILADLLTLHEHYHPFTLPRPTGNASNIEAMAFVEEHANPLKSLEGKKLAWVGDTNNITNELLVTVPRMGAHLAIASPKGYDKVDPRVWARVEEAGTTGNVTLTNDPAEALKDADVVITDTWISMGQEEEKQARLEAFKGYQITNEMVESAGAKPNWVFLHCLPRKQEEVADEVFYSDRSLVFPEAENRKWTMIAVFAAFFRFDNLFGPRSRYPPLDGQSQSE